MADGVGRINFIIAHLRVDICHQPVTDKSCPDSRTRQMKRGDKLRNLERDPGSDLCPFKKGHAPAVEIVAGGQENEWSVDKGFQRDFGAIFLLKAMG